MTAAAGKNPPPPLPKKHTFGMERAAGPQMRALSFFMQEIVCIASKNP